MDSRRDNLTPEQLARAFLDHIEWCAKEALECEKLQPNDRETLEKGLARLRPAFNELSGNFIEPLRETKPSLADHGYEQLWAVIGWAFAVGAKADVQASSKSYHDAEEIKPTLTTIEKRTEERNEHVKSMIRDLKAAGSKVTAKAVGIPGRTLRRTKAWKER